MKIWTAMLYHKLCLSRQPDDQYVVECVALADRNHNLLSETGLRYPSLLVMNNRHLTTQRLSVICPFKGVHNSTTTGTERFEFFPPHLHHKISRIEKKFPGLAGFNLF